MMSNLLFLKKKIGQKRMEAGVRYFRRIGMPNLCWGENRVWLERMRCLELIYSLSFSVIQNTLNLTGDQVPDHMICSAMRDSMPVIRHISAQSSKFDTRGDRDVWCTPSKRDSTKAHPLYKHLETSRRDYAIYLFQS